VQPWIALAIVVALIALGYLAQRLGWIDLSNKARSGGSSGGISGIGDEVFHPTRHETQLELDRQTLLPAPAPLAGDGDKGVYSGRIEIDLDKRRG
jgi:hypothetical protein